MTDAPDDTHRRILLPTPGDVPCPTCGYLNTPQTERCGVCGATLPGQTPPPDAADTANDA